MGEQINPLATELATSRSRDQVLPDAQPAADTREVFEASVAAVLWEQRRFSFGRFLLAAVAVVVLVTGGFALLLYVLSLRLDG